MKILIFQLPFVDIVFIRKILSYYEKLSVKIPKYHAIAGILERLFGYLPLGYILTMLLGFKTAITLALIVYAVFGPVELALMLKGTKPWDFFKGKDSRTVTKIFLIEAYSTFLYYLVGSFIRCFL